MKLRLIKLRDRLADSFWFVPAAMAVLAVGLALGSVAFDHAVGTGWIENLGWVFAGGADGARSVLSAISSSVMTVVSIVFSLTIATLSQTSSHYGPRVLRNFTSDRRVQFTMGTFIATFVYCLLVLRTVRSVQESTFVPYLSVTVGVTLALASLGVLIFFIHYVSQSIQAENLIAGVGEDFHKMLETFFPEELGEDRERQSPPDASYWRDTRRVDALESGYLQRVDEKTLMELATRHDLQLRLVKRPGEFVGRGTPYLHVLPSGAEDGEIADALRECFSLGNYRTRHQDALFSLQQLVEIAAHALSPGINEPFTALTCIDWLGSGLRGVIRRDLPAPDRYDTNGKLRVLVPAVTFEEFARAAFDQIRVYGASNPDVVVRLLNAIASLAPDIRRADDRAVLRHHVRLIGADAADQLKNEHDRARAAEHLKTTLATL